MGKIIIKGVKKDGTIDAERKSTAVLITELIAAFPGLCEADVRHSLEEIRLSAEQDDRIRQTYAHVLKERRKSEKV